MAQGIALGYNYQGSDPVLPPFFYYTIRFQRSVAIVAIQIADPFLDLREDLPCCWLVATKTVTKTDFSPLLPSTTLESDCSGLKIGKHGLLGHEQSITMNSRLL
jgi:hypothetical protein